MNSELKPLYRISLKYKANMREYIKYIKKRNEENIIALMIHYINE